MSWPSEQRFGPWEQHGVFAHIMGHDEPLDLSRQKRLHLQYDKYGALDLSLKANGHDGDKQDQPSLDAVITQNTTPHESPEYLRPSSVTSTKMANNVPVGMTMHQSRLHTFLAKLCCRHQSLLLQILRSNVPSHCSGVVQTPADLQNHSGASQLPSYSLPWIRAEANFESYRHSPLENRASHNGHATFEYIQPALFPRSCSYRPIPNISYRDGTKWPGGGRTDVLGSQLDTKGIMEDCYCADGCVKGQKNTMHPLDNFILRENASLMVKQERNAQEPLSTPSVAVLSHSTESSSISVQGISNSMASSTPTSWNKSNRSTQPTSNGFTSQHLGHPQEFNKGKQPAAVLSRSDGSVVDLQSFNGNKLGKSFEEVQAFPKMTNKVVDNQKITNFLQQVVSYQNCKQDLVLATPRSVWDSWLDNGGIPMTIPVEKGSYLTGEQVGGEYWRHDVLLNKNMKVNCCLNENKTLYKLGGDCLDNSKCSGPATIVNESQGAGFDDLNSSPTDNKLVTNGASSTPSGPASDLTGQQDIVYVGHSGNQEQNGSLTVASTPITFSPQRHSARKSTRGHLYSESHYELQTLWLTAHSRRLSEMASDMTLPLAQSLLDSHNLTTDMHDGVAGISCDVEITNHNSSHKFDQLTSNKQLLQVSEIQNITESVNKVKLQQKISGDQACENVMEFNKCKESLEDSTKVLEENDDSQRKKHYKGKVQRKRKKGQKLVVALESLCRFRKREKLDGRVKAQGEEAYSRSILHLPDNGDQIMLTSVCNGNEEKEDSTPAQSNFHKIKHEDNPAPLMSVAKSHMIETMPPAVDLAPSDEVLSLSTVKDDMSTCSKENGPYKRCFSEKKLRKRKREFAMPMQNSTSDGMVLRKRHGFRFSSSEKTSNGSYCEVKVLNASNFMHENSHKISTPPSSVTNDDEGEEMQDNPEEMHNQMKSTAKCDTPWPLISRPELNIVVWNHNTETVNREVYTSEHKSVCVPYVEGLNDNMEDVTAEENDERLKNTSSLSGSVTRCRRQLRTTRDKRNGYCRGKTSLGFLISVDAETLKQRTVIASAELLISAPFGDFDFSSDEELEETTWKRPRRRKYKKRLIVNNSKNTGAKKRGRKPRACREILSIPSRDCADDIFFGYTRKTNGLQNTRGMGLNENECFDALTQNLMPFADSAKNFKNEGTYSENESHLADLLLYGISDNDLALINSKFEQANRLWVPLQKVACPLLKPTRVKGRRRVEEDQPESNLKTSYIRQLFSSGLNLPDICKWFKEPTEDTKRKRVKVDDDERPTSFVKPEDKRTTETNKNCTSVVDPIESCIRQGKCSPLQFPSFMPSKSNSEGLTTREPKQPFCGIEQTSHLQSKQETYHNSSSLQGTCIC